MILLNNSQLKFRIKMKIPNLFGIVIPKHQNAKRLLTKRITSDFLRTHLKIHRIMDFPSR